LKRRNVFRVAIAYVLLGWAVLQGADFLLDLAAAPQWVIRVFAIAGLVGFPFALFFAWAYELTPEGIKREKNVDRSTSITRQTGRKLNRLIIAFLVVAVGILLLDKIYLRTGRNADANGATDGPRTIAVLPFVNLSDDSDHFADGLSEELLNLLAKSPDLKVAGRTSSFAFKGRNEDLREIGEALGVEHVLEGSVRRSGERLRITAQLVEVDDGFHVWSDTYDRQMADIFDIQDDVAGAITDALKLRLSPKSDRATANPEAYALYLQAVGLQTAGARGAAGEAQRLLDQAIALDPQFARAYELKAGFYWFQSGWLIDAPTAQALAYEAAMKALEIDPTLAGARSFARTASPDWTWVGEFEALEELVRVEPDNVRALDSLTWDMVLAGYFSEALGLAERIIELEPVSPGGYLRKVEVLAAMGRDAEARAAAVQVATEFGHVNAIWYLGVCALFDGDDVTAIAWLEKTWVALGRDPIEVRPLVTGARDPASGEAFLDERVRSADANAAGIFERRLARTWYLPFGYLDAYWRAIDTLSEGIGKGWTNADLLEYGGIMWRRSGFAKHPQYLQRARAQGLTDLWDTHGPPEHCTKASGDWVCE
jgi:TolB-like protein